jgi:hypothetical protein
MSFICIDILLADESPEAFTELKLHLFEKASKLRDWFANNYVHDGLRRHYATVLLHHSSV